MSEQHISGRPEPEPMCHGCDELEQEIVWLRAALFLANRHCEFIHHPNRDQHDFGEQCPVEARIEAALHPETKEKAK